VTFPVSLSAALAPTDVTTPCYCRRRSVAWSIGVTGCSLFTNVAATVLATHCPGLHRVNLPSLPQLTEVAVEAARQRGPFQAGHALQPRVCLTSQRPGAKCVSCGWIYDEKERHISLIIVSAACFAKPHDETF
jgi:hypothetical protein